LIKIKKIILLPVSVLFLAIACVVSYKHIAPSEEPNIILIIVDTLRPDHLGCYGYRRDTSPSVDKFAEENLLFENCFAHAPNTSSSCSSILTGLLPHEAKVLDNDTLLPLQLDTVAEILKKKGYETTAVISNYVLREGQGFDQGFNVYNDRMDDEELVRKRPERIAEKTTECAIGYLKQYRDKKFFMWIHYQDPHGPYTPQPPFNGLFKTSSKAPFHLGLLNSNSGLGGIPLYQRLGNNTDYDYYVSQYDGEIRYFDESFKALIASLKELGLYDNTLIIFTADHGEGMGGHNYFFAHGKYVYNSQIHVPLIIRYKNRASGRRKNFVQHIDIASTIFKAAGIPLRPYMRGRDLLRKKRDAKEIFSVMKGKVRRGYLVPRDVDVLRSSIIVDGLKLIRRTYGGSEDDYFLFDIRKDPREEKNIVEDAAYGRRLEHLKNRMDSVRRENLLGLDVEAEKPEYPDEVKEKLKSLGYAQ